MLLKEWPSVHPTLGWWIIRSCTRWLLTTVADNQSLSSSNHVHLSSSCFGPDSTLRWKSSWQVPVVEQINMLQDQMWTVDDHWCWKSSSKTQMSIVCSVMVMVLLFWCISFLLVYVCKLISCSKHDGQKTVIDETKWWLTMAIDIESASWERQDWFSPSFELHGSQSMPGPLTYFTIEPMLLQKIWVQRAPHVFFCNLILVTAYHPPVITNWPSRDNSSNNNNNNNNLICKVPYVRNFRGVETFTLPSQWPLVVAHHLSHWFSCSVGCCYFVIPSVPSCFSDTPSNYLATVGKGVHSHPCCS